MRGVKGTRTTLATLATALAAIALAAPAGAMADATPAPENRYSSTPGLPDGRVYEQVSPANKDGAVAGAENSGEPRYALATAGAEGGEPSVLFGTVGPVGSEPQDALDGASVFSVARRSPSGWRTQAALPLPPGTAEAADAPIDLLASADLSRFAFTVQKPFSTRNPFPNDGGSIYLGASAGAIAWIGEPLVAEPDPPLGQVRLVDKLAIAGGSPGLDRIYFGYYGTLVPEDEGPFSRGALLAEHGGANEESSDWGFYEWQEGRGLVNAGKLPDGRFDRFGAVAAATLDRLAPTPAGYDNEVSEDGSRALFVSPDPSICPLPPLVPRVECEGDLPQLYVREDVGGGERGSVLASRYAAGGLEGPAGTPALHGLVEGVGTVARSLAFGAPDGSRAFFASRDRLTADAPADTTVKVYAFDAVDGTLEYLSGVGTPIVGSSSDGSQVVFENLKTQPAQLELWSGGQATPLAALGTPAGGRELFMGPVRVAAGGSTVLLATDAQVPGFNDGGGFEQVFRYHRDASGAQLACASCPPAGVAPRSDAHLSNDDQGEIGSAKPLDSRGVSSDGSRVFFDTANPLVARDVNGTRDVYEWSEGHVSLLSAGTGGPSYFLDNDASGQDVFFTTAAGLVPADTDGGYDVYDARVGGIPGLGEAGAPALCAADCQPGPSSPPALAAPVSATFAGAGNPAATVVRAKPVKRKQSKHRRRRRRPARRSRSRRSTRAKGGVR